VRTPHEIDPTTPLVVTPPLYNTGMMKEIMMNDSTELYATLARINARIAADNAEREQWIRDYDRVCAQRTDA